MIKPLTSLRFIFAFLVFLSHYQYLGKPIFSEGYIGVSFFFILSGFVLTYSYKDRLINKKITNRDFFIARFARIYPLHIATFLAATILIFLTKQNIVFFKALSNITLTQSWIFDKAYYFSFNAPSWSISDEAFFYLLFPLLIIFFNKTYRKSNILSIAFVAISYPIVLYYLIDNIDSAHYYLYVNPLFRLIDFIIGIGIYEIFERKMKPEIKPRNVWFASIQEIGAIGLLIIMVIVSYELPQPIRYSCYYWLPMALIIYVFSLSNKNEGGIISKIMSTKLFVLLGEVSFGFYMIHALVIQVADFGFKNASKIFGFMIPDIIQFIITFILILILSIMSFYWFETPLNKWIKGLNIKNNQEK